MSKWMLALASGMAVIASTCCVLPLLLVAAGVTGAWMGSLRLAQPYAVGLALGSALLLVVLWKRILQPAKCRETGLATCDRPGRGTQVVFWFTVSLTTVILSSPAWAPLFY